jgi:hypothetical protein
LALGLILARRRAQALERLERRRRCSGDPRLDMLRLNDALDDRWR